MSWLGGEQLVLQAAIGDGHAFDALALGENRVAARRANKSAVNVIAPAKALARADASAGCVAAAVAMPDSSISLSDIATEPDDRADGGQ